MHKIKQNTTKNKEKKQENNENKRKRMKNLGHYEKTIVKATFRLDFHGKNESKAALFDLVRLICKGFIALNNS